MKPIINVKYQDELLQRKNKKNQHEYIFHVPAKRLTNIS